MSEGFFNATPFGSMMKRRSGVARFFQTIFPSLVPTYVVGRDFDDVNRPLYGAFGQVINLASGTGGSLNMLNGVDVEVQSITWRTNHQLAGEANNVVPPVSYGVLSTAFNTSDLSPVSLFEPQFRPSLGGGAFLPGVSRWFVGIFTMPPPPLVIGNRYVGPAIMTGAPGAVFSTGFPSTRIEFDPVLVIPRGAGFWVAMESSTGSLTGFEAAVEYRELGGTR